MDTYPRCWSTEVNQCSAKQHCDGLTVLQSFGPLKQSRACTLDLKTRVAVSGLGEQPGALPKKNCPRAVLAQVGSCQRHSLKRFVYGRSGAGRGSCQGRSQKRNCLRTFWSGENPKRDCLRAVSGGFIAFDRVLFPRFQ